MSGGDDYVRVPLTGDYDDEDEFNVEGNMESKPKESKETRSETGSTASPWNFEYYQRFFDVDTKEAAGIIEYWSFSTDYRTFIYVLTIFGVLTRLAFSLLPNPRMNFVQHTLKPKADLYGPFWIATTLMMVAAMVYWGLGEFHLFSVVFRLWCFMLPLTFASTIIYIYWWLVPLGLFAFSAIRRRRAASRRNADGESDLTDLLDGSQSVSGSRRRQSSDGYSLFTLLSVYGYSLTIFVPVSILWTIQNHPLQWILVALAMGISGAFLGFALLPLLKREHPKMAFPLITTVVLLNCAFTMLLMLTFFYGSPVQPAQTISPVQLPIQQQQQQQQQVEQQKPGHVAPAINEPGVAAPAANKVKRSSPTNTTLT